MDNQVLKGIFPGQRYKEGEGHTIEQTVLLTKTTGLTMDEIQQRKNCVWANIDTTDDGRDLTSTMDIQHFNILSKLCCDGRLFHKCHGSDDLAATVKLVSILPNVKQMDNYDDLHLFLVKLVKSKFGGDTRKAQDTIRTKMLDFFKQFFEDDGNADSSFVKVVENQLNNDEMATYAIGIGSLDNTDRPITHPTKRIDIKACGIFNFIDNIQKTGKVNCMIHSDDPMFHMFTTPIVCSLLGVDDNCRNKNLARNLIYIAQHLGMCRGMPYPDMLLTALDGMRKFYTDHLGFSALSKDLKRIDNNGDIETTVGPCLDDEFVLGHLRNWGQLEREQRKEVMIEGQSTLVRRNYIRYSSSNDDDTNSSTSATEGTSSTALTSDDEEASDPEDDYQPTQKESRLAKDVAQNCVQPARSSACIKSKKPAEEPTKVDQASTAKTTAPRRRKKGQAKKGRGDIEDEEFSLGSNERVVAPKGRGSSKAKSSSKSTNNGKRKSSFEVEEACIDPTKSGRKMKKSKSLKKKEESALELDEDMDDVAVAAEKSKRLRSSKRKQAKPTKAADVSSESEMEANTKEKKKEEEKKKKSTSPKYADTESIVLEHYKEQHTSPSPAEGYNTLTLLLGSNVRYEEWDPTSTNIDTRAWLRQNTLDPTNVGSRVIKITEGKLWRVTNGNQSGDGCVLLLVTCP